MGYCFRACKETGLNCNIDDNNDIISHGDFDCEWVFIKSHCMGCATYFKGKRVLGLQIHY